MAFKVDFDKSPQGFIDEDIIPLLEVLNKRVFSTTSSCSGRITVMSGAKKGESKWIYKSHTEADVEAVWNVVSGLADDEVVRFFYEPFIVHVKCKDFESASSMLSLLHLNGLKKSGMISGKKLLVEINDTGRIETILDNSLGFEYIEKLVLEANKRLESTKKRIKLCERLFSGRD